MCGRYTFFTPPQIIEKRFSVKVNDEVKPRYNAAPTQLLPVIRNTEAREITYLSWGLIPHWATDDKGASKLINARSETLVEKPSFRNALKKRRCLVLTDGFYEWAHDEHGKKYPVRVSLKSKEPFAMAGLWEHWVNPKSGEIQETFTIVTTAANERIRPIHERMPAFLTEETEKIWLDNTKSVDDWLAVLKPYPQELIEVQRVSKLVNSNRNEGEELLQPEEEQDELRLF